ncbi:MAG TPA: hypothetical protein VHZ74_10700 [Bryobacteraceae bacterium]|jgi:hypothetical protein|nr:hypothetical protein [Bryobacteraceae bacterium]
MGKLAKSLHGALAVGIGAGATVLQHWISEGNFDFSPQHMKAAAMGAVVAVLLYFAKSPNSGE